MIKQLFNPFMVTLMQNVLLTLRHLIVLATPITLYSQNFEVNIQLDSVIKFGDFYYWHYNIGWGVAASTYWDLGHNGRLYRVTTSDSPVGVYKVEVGNWHLKQDSVILKVPETKKYKKYGINSRRYRIFQFYIKTDDSEKNAFDIVTYFILLVDKTDFNPQQLLITLRDFVLNEIGGTTKNYEDQLEYHVVVGNLVENYLAKSRIVYGMKLYLNNGLRGHSFKD